MNVTMGRGPGLDSASVAGVSPDNASGSSGKSTSEQQADSGHPDSPDDDGLGPLPPNWEKAFTEKGEPYFIDHNSGILRSILSTNHSQIVKMVQGRYMANMIFLGWGNV